jgi:hypothetical protein
MLVWSEELPDWQRDALRRIAISEILSDEDRADICARLKHAHGIAVEGETGCVPLAEAHLPAEANGGGTTVLCGIGPVEHVDRLAAGYELRFGVDGITLIYGDNGTGKSGYARIAKKLCLARVVDPLQGDVFAEQGTPPARVRVRYRLAGAPEPQTQDWVDGEPRPAALARMMVLDGANVKVYVDGQSEITYLPREIEIAARLGELFTGLGTEVQRDADAIAQRCRGPYGAGYAPTTPAGRLIARLTIETVLDALPSEAALREAASWDAAREAELAELTVVLAQDPAAQAAARRRAVDILGALADNVDAITRELGDDAVGKLGVRMAEAVRTADAAALAAQERFSEEPIPQTGQGAWEQLYRLARQFAAEAGVRNEEASFQSGDPCPVCQHALDEEGARRLQRFDEFIHGAAAAAAATARAELETAIENVSAVQVPPLADVDRNLGEYRAFGEAEAQTAARVRNFVSAAEARRNAVLAGIEVGEIDGLEVLSESPSEVMRAEIARLADEAARLEEQPAQDPVRFARAGELRDAERLAEELDAVLARRAELELRLRLVSCRAALDTRGISQFATRRRRELVTPDLRNRIMAEIQHLDLGHVPFRFAEASERGRNYFDVALDARRQAVKARVLSEGEQRALGIACFFAEMGRIPGNHGIIVDDPVSSLDHQRLRKVAERLVEEAAAGRQVIVFTHHLIFYQEMLAAAAARVPQVPVLVNLIGKADGRFGLVSENDEPWIAKKVMRRIEALRARLGAIPAGMNRDSDAYRRLAKDFYTDLRETWERLVEEVLLDGVVQRFCSAVKTQSLKGVLVEDGDYQVIFANMTRVSECSGHDMAPGRQIPVPDLAEMRRDLDTLDDYRNEIHRRKNSLRARREELEEPPVAQVV